MLEELLIQRCLNQALLLEEREKEEMEGTLGSREVLLNAKGTTSGRALRSHGLSPALSSGQFLSPRSNLETKLGLWMLPKKALVG